MDSNADQVTTGQMEATRAERWHQAGNAVLSVEQAREWLGSAGLVQYGPKDLGAPAPSLVEATLGRKEAEPGLADGEAAKSLLARMVAEGSAVPLNLLGAVGGTGTDVPDFVVPAGVFSYIFTLRGNKAWKQSPVTSGAVKVSPLALAAYELLAAKVTLSAYDLTTQLGSGVTEAAVLRALTELWGQLRVLPVWQQDGSATLWELSTARFTKQIKSGANAGQPTALSALISLYLGQAVAATEDEVCSFLSPLAARSRVRDVVHALMAARQLETLVIEGKTLVHVGGDLPAFAAAAPAESSEEAGEAAEGEGEPRIGKFAARPGSKLGTGLRTKPAFAKKPGFGGKPAFGGGDRERRPFQREERGAAAPRFDRPWQEKRPAVGGGEAGGLEAGGEEGGERKSFAPRTFERKPFEKKPFERRDRPSFGNKPAFGGKPSFGNKPRFEGRQEGFAGGSNAAGEGRPPRREFGARDGADGPRKTFSKPGTFGRKREGSAGGDGPAFGGGEGRPPRREFGGGERPGGGGGFKRPGSYAPRPGAFGSRPEGGERPAYGRKGGEEGGEAPKRVFRKFDAPRDKKPFGAKPFGAKPGGFGAKPFGDRPARPFGDRPAKPFGDRPARSFGDRPESGERGRPEGRSGFGGKPAFGGKPSFGTKSGFGGGKKPFSPGGASKGPGGPFAKFADGKKPFRKPGPGKPKPGGGGGFGPVKRRRPEGNS